MTIRELFRELVAARERHLDEHDRRVMLAWEIAALTRGTKGLPRLDSLLARRTTGLPLTRSLADQRAQLERFAQRYGLPVRKTRLIRRA
jgi:hypothetical protein